MTFFSSSEIRNMFRNDMEYISNYFLNKYKINIRSYCLAEHSLCGWDADLKDVTIEYKITGFYINKTKKVEVIDFVNGIKEEKRKKVIKDILK